jgi:hypothetical protein
VKKKFLENFILFMYNVYINNFYSNFIFFKKFIFFRKHINTIHSYLFDTMIHINAEKTFFFNLDVSFQLHKQYFDENTVFIFYLNRYTLLLSNLISVNFDLYVNLNEVLKMVFDNLNTSAISKCMKKGWGLNMHLFYRNLFSFVKPKNDFFLMGLNIRNFFFFFKLIPLMKDPSIAEEFPKDLFKKIGFLKIFLWMHVFYVELNLSNIFLRNFIPFSLWDYSIFLCNRIFFGKIPLKDFFFYFFYKNNFIIYTFIKNNFSFEKSIFLNIFKQSFKFKLKKRVFLEKYMSNIMRKLLKKVKPKFLLKKKSKRFKRKFKKKIKNIFWIKRRQFFKKKFKYVLFTSSLKKKNQVYLNKFFYLNYLMFFFKKRLAFKNSVELNQVFAKLFFDGFFFFYKRAFFLCLYSFLQKAFTPFKRRFFFFNLKTTNISVRLNFYNFFKKMKARSSYTFYSSIKNSFKIKKKLKRKIKRLKYEYVNLKINSIFLKNNNLCLINKFNLFFFFKKYIYKRFFNFKWKSISFFCKNKTIINKWKSKKKVEILKNNLYELNFFKYFFIAFFQKNFFSKINFANSVNFLNFFFLKYFVNLKTISNNSKKVIFDSNIVYNNYTPLNFISKARKSIIINKLQKDSAPFFFKYFYNCFISFFEFFFKKNVFLNIKSDLKISGFFKRYINTIFIFNKLNQVRIGRGFFFYEMLEICWLTFFHRDLNFLIAWLVLTMERLPFELHKKFLSTFKSILVGYSDFFVYDNGVDGFFFDIRGKVGVSGNSRKRKFCFNIGKYSKTTKNSKFDYQYNVVRTDTGALGLTLIMYF